MVLLMTKEKRVSLQIKFSKGQTEKEWIEDTDLSNIYEIKTVDLEID